MKNVLLLALLAGLVACNSKGNNDKATNANLPLPGALVDSISVPYTDDSLNHFLFSVVITADSYIDRGVYDVTVALGPDTARGVFTMPKGGEHFLPIIQRSTTTASNCIIGFRASSDTTFYPYFGIKAKIKAITMDYTNTYTFQ